MEKEDIKEKEKKSIVKDEIEKACKNEEQKKFIPFGYLATAPTLSSSRFRAKPKISPGNCNNSLYLTPDKPCILATPSAASTTVPIST